jgi:hypothetical protein
LRITKKRTAIAGVTALALAGAGAFITVTGADAAAVAGGKCSPRSGVTGSPTLICAPVPSSPTAYRWRQIVAAKGPAGPAGPKGAPGPAGKDGKNGVTDLQADGPYPGATKVEGGNSSTEWAAGDKKQTAWVRCPAGKKAIGGGFSVGDQGDAVYRKVQVVSSYPYSLDEKGDFDKDGVLPNKDGSLLPNAWVVEGFYNADTGTALIRPWVICAKVN